MRQGLLRRGVRVLRHARRLPHALLRHLGAALLGHLKHARPCLHRRPRRQHLPSLRLGSLQPRRPPVPQRKGATGLALPLLSPLLRQHGLQLLLVLRALLLLQFVQRHRLLFAATLLPPQQRVRLLRLCLGLLCCLSRRISLGLPLSPLRDCRPLASLFLLLPLSLKKSILFLSLPRSFPVALTRRTLFYLLQLTRFLLSFHPSPLLDQFLLQRQPAAVRNEPRHVRFYFCSISTRDT
mmetsp:Transcript_2379/g.4010  ORF Transcript_2379/g.4010 Transcript_2379/m.4010 type:complete len:238 (-) Transcript_2379:238-951(-)